MHPDPKVSKQPVDPLVSIVIPTFNRAVWLRDCVRSALMQTYRHVEVVVSDNASTDETQAVLAEFCDPRLRIIRQERNLGLMPNWNACLRAARGEYIVFLADDDRLAPTMLERCIALLSREPQLNMIVALNELWLTEESRTLPAMRSRSLGTGIHDGAVILLEYLDGKLSIQLCSIMMRTDALRSYGGFAEDWPFCGDTAAWGRLLMSGRAGLVNDCCATFAWHQASATSRSSAESRIESGRRFIEEMYDAVSAHIADAELQKRIRRGVRHYIARNAVDSLACYRRSGASSRQILPVVWRCRREFGYLVLASRNIGAVARSLAILVLPGRVTDWIASIKQSVRNGVRARSVRYRSNHA